MMSGEFLLQIEQTVLQNPHIRGIGFGNPIGFDDFDDLEHCEVASRFVMLKFDESPLQEEEDTSLLARLTSLASIICTDPFFGPLSIIAPRLSHMSQLINLELSFVDSGLQAPDEELVQLPSVKTYTIIHECSILPYFYELTELVDRIKYLKGIMPNLSVINVEMSMCFENTHKREDLLSIHQHAREMLKQWLDEQGVRMILTMDGKKVIE